MTSIKLNRNTNNKSGMALIEVVISILILSSVFLLYSQSNNERQIDNKISIKTKIFLNKKINPNNIYIIETNKLIEYIR
jgi:prepilin-type N-terminal cleavage/methylation domain-containing protein